MTHIDMQVLLVLGERQTIDARCTPWVNITINIHHLRIILGQEIHGIIVKLWRELHVLGTLRHHQFLQITLWRLDAQVSLEWLGVISVISQLFGSLYIERCSGIVVGEILRFTHVDPVFEHLVVGGIIRRNLLEILTPLPEGEGILEHRVIENLGYRRIEAILLLAAVLLEHRQQRSLAPEEQQLEVEHLLSVLLGRNLFLQELLVSAILHALVQRRHVWHGNIHIVREVSTVEHRGLSALADTRGNPLALIHRMQGLVYVVQIVERVLHGEVIPVARLRHRLVEIAVLHGDDVGIEELGKFLDVSLAQCILGVVAFCYEHGRTVESSVAEYHSLLKTALGSILGIQLLLDEEHIFFREMRTFQRFHITHSRQRRQQLARLSQFCRQHLQRQDEEQQHQFQESQFQFHFRLSFMFSLFKLSLVISTYFKYYAKVRIYFHPAKRNDILLAFLR